MNWRNDLKQLKLDYLKRTSPDFFTLSGGDRMKLKPWNDNTSNGLMRAVTDWLKYNNHYCNRISSTGVARKINGKLQYTHGNTNLGTSDLIAIINGKSVHLEIKCSTTKDKVRPEQVKEKSRVEASGGVYVVIHSMEQFCAWYGSFVTNKMQQQ